MGVRATITHQWPDGSVTDCEVGSDQDAHPDLIDEMVKRVLFLYRETCTATEEDKT